MRAATTSGISSTLMASAQSLALTPTLVGAQSFVQCVWCGKDVDANEPVIEIGGAVMHDPRCRDDYEAQVYGSDYDLDAYDLREPEPSRVLDYARSDDRAIINRLIERMIRIPVEVE